MRAMKQELTTKQKKKKARIIAYLNNVGMRYRDGSKIDNRSTLKSLGELMDYYYFIMQ